MQIFAKKPGLPAGYEHGAKVIIETDDDNLPTLEFWKAAIPIKGAFSLKIRDGLIFTVTIRRRISGRGDSH